MTYKNNIIFFVNIIGTEMSHYKPLHKSNLILKDLGDEFLIYSAKHKELHVMNPTAQLIWSMCDGKHSVMAMEEEMRKHFSIPLERDIRGDIQNAINTFRDKGLLQNDVESG
jgi:hypothetical protein